jgi:natural resistance-associated macrophage protein
MSIEFRPALILQIVCWLLTAVVVAFDIFLFIQHVTNVTSAVAIGVGGAVYLIFLVYLIWKPLQDQQSGWMSVPQDEEEEASSSSDSYQLERRADDDSEEIYVIQ